MKTIMALRIEGLKLAQEMAYFYFVNSAVTEYDIIGERFAKSYNMFKAAYDHQNELYLRHDRKILTQIVQEKDVLRDKWFRKLRNNLREICEFGSGEKQAAAEFLSTIVEEYGGAKIPDLQQEEESGKLLNLYEDLQEKYPERVALLGLTSVVESAKQANEEFLEAQNNRTQSDADYGKGAMEEARPVTAKKYRYFIDCVNVEAEVDTEGVLTPFIDYMNAKISEMRRLAGQNPSSSSSSGSGTEEEEEGVIRTKTATFKFIGGRSESFPVEVGTPLVAPSNTEGYKWKPEVPEFMPGTNKTFKEVAIEAEEVTATFHFADHTEEEIKGHVGTALTAPQNTEGCYWAPTVPTVMPDEDTAYYELPVEEAEPTLYTATFKFHDDTEDSVTAPAGAPLNAPTPDAGYKWTPTPPATMPERNSTYFEVAEDETLYTVAWFLPNGNPIIWYELPAGVTIPEAPKAPEGYYWHPYPSIMPEHDLDIIPKPING